MKRLLIASALLLFRFHPVCDALDGKLLISQYQKQHWQMEDGLGSPSSICQCCFWYCEMSNLPSSASHTGWNRNNNKAEAIRSRFIQVRYTLSRFYGAYSLQNSSQWAFWLILSPLRYEASDQM